MSHKKISKSFSISLHTAEELKNIIWDTRESASALISRLINQESTRMFLKAKTKQKTIKPDLTEIEK